LGILGIGSENTFDGGLHAIQQQMYSRFMTAMQGRKADSSRAEPAQRLTGFAVVNPPSSLGMTQMTE
jgi:hypothetical protein